MTNNILIALAVFLFMIILLVSVIKKEFLEFIYNLLKNNIPGYAKKILLAVVIILLLFLVVFEILQYQNIDILKLK